ncbi:MAG: sulfotransferase [Rhodospirillales bacterium]|nr:sulfotransferase [Rhodospirillales bacterium]
MTVQLFAPELKTMNRPRHVFIGGLPRSGTTLIARILAQHPDVSAFSDTGVGQDEGQFLQSVYPTAISLGGPGRFAFDPAAHLTETSRLLSEENKSKLRREWNKYWNLEKTVLVEKTPMNILISRFLNQIFADCYFIFMTRHPIAVSIATQKWSRTSIFSLMNHWLVAHEILAADIEFLPGCAVIPYERLVNDPEPILRGLEKALALGKSAYKFHLDSGVNDKYFKIWADVFHRRANRTLPGLGNLKDIQRADIPQSGKAMPYLTSVARPGAQGGGQRPMLLTDPLSESQDAIALFGERIERLGYSLEDLTLCPDVIAK